MIVIIQSVEPHIAFSWTKCSVTFFHDGICHLIGMGCSQSNAVSTGEHSATIRVRMCVLLMTYQHYWLSFKITLWPSSLIYHHIHDTLSTCLLFLIYASNYRYIYRCISLSGVKLSLSFVQKR